MTENRDYMKKHEKAPDWAGYRKISEEDALLLVDTGTVFLDHSPFESIYGRPYNMESTEEVAESAAWANRVGNNYQFYWKVEIENDEDNC